MKYKIARASAWDSKIKPCKDAYPGKITVVDERNFSSVEELYEYVDKQVAEKGFAESWAKDMKNWLNEGTNHRVENGHIKRDLREEDCWYIDINTLEELIKLKEEVGDIILRTSMEDSKTPEILIYDDYIE